MKIRVLQLAQQCSRATGPSKAWARIFLVGLHVLQQIILKEKFYCSLLKQPKEHYEPTTHSRMAQPRVRIGPMAHSRSGAPGTPDLIVGLGRKSSRPPGLRRGPNNGIRSFQSDGQALSTDEQNPSVGSHHGTLAHFACFSSLSRAPHRASQHRQSASKRRREPSLRRACPPVGGRAGVERHHGVANRLGFFLGHRKLEPVFFPHDASTADAWSATVET
jgi:hypothetical protein